MNEKKVVVMGLCIVSILGIFAKPHPYYAKILSADGLLGQKEVTEVVVIKPTTNTNGQVCQKYRFGNTNLQITIQDGLIVAMSRDEQLVELEVPKVDLRGSAEWNSLSRRFYEEAIRSMSFPLFFSGVPISEQETRIPIRTDAMGDSVEVVNTLTGRNRTLNWISKDFVLHSSDVKYNGNRMRLLESVTFSSGGNHAFSYSCPDFIAAFYPNGGLKRLRVLNPKYGNIYQERRWSEDGKLIRDTDVRNGRTPILDLKPFDPIR